MTSSPTDNSATIETPRRRVSFASSIIGNNGQLFGGRMSLRSSHKADFISGATASKNTREQIAMLRPSCERKAMGKIARKRAVSRTNNGRCLLRCCISKDGDNSEQHRNRKEDNNDIDDQDIPLQYTLESRRCGTTSNKSFIPFRTFRQKLCFFCSRTTISPESAHCFFIDVNGLISSYFSWSFRTSYVTLFGVFALFYYGLILLFSVLFYGIVAVYPECINSAGQIIGEGVGARKFGDCFQLSWTTFSTVGYGVIFPATGASEFMVPIGCVGVGFLGSFEAFLGVIYAGFCGAILFSKVLRSQNNAQVLFSDPIVIRFGRSELESSNNNLEEARRKDYDEENMGEEKGIKSMASWPSNKERGIPCPSLEFRLVNRLHDIPSGEIVEAKLEVIAILNPNVSSKNNTLQNSDFLSTPNTLGVTEKSTLAELVRALQDANTRKATRSLNFHSSNSKRPHMFTKIALDAEEHPYFRRVWFGRHRLDEDSPLLTPAARNRIKEANGYWPADMNNHESIKSAIHFRHLLVCIKGVSNANHSIVYAQKVYDLVDVNVGYRFVPMIYREDDGSLKTDTYLLNAVYQQRGGGGEPFH